MSIDSSATGLLGRVGTVEPAASALCPYYGSGEQLKAKHVGTTMVSGRKLEDWALELVPLQASARLLDAGCGWGRFSWPLIEEFEVESSHVAGCDSSLGMLLSAKQEAERRQLQPNLVAADIQALPFKARYFDGVMANHVLYHLPDIRAGIGELARVVKEEGWLLATTNSDDVRVPVLDFHYAALDQLGIDYVSEAHSPFSMENGKQILGSGFRTVDAFWFEDETQYCSADEFLASYRTIGRYRNLLVREDIDAERKRKLPILVRQQAEEVIDEEGVLRCPVRMGAFLCKDPVRS